MTAKEHTEQSPWADLVNLGGASSSVLPPMGRGEGRRTRRTRWEGRSLEALSIPWVSVATKPVFPWVHPMWVSVLSSESCLKLSVCLGLYYPYRSHRTSKGSKPLGTEGLGVERGVGSCGFRSLLSLWAAVSYL